MTHVLTPTVREESVLGSSGLNIFVRSWRPQGAARAVVVICHGLNAHSGQYQGVGEQFAADGLAVYALDLRGRGRSDGERFYVEKFADYVSDLATVIAGEGAGTWLVRVLAQAQRRRGRLLHLHARASGRARRSDLREFCVSDSGARLCDRGSQGHQSPRPARARGEAPQRR